ncbi:hypothetical protein [Paraliomyxa miuraensis]|nr:hypothetical protein [Paraliomyxa miuraensis]MCX4240213.1 hypothetical protein [Paraliomyxa miuraensis]
MTLLVGLGLVRRSVVLFFAAVGRPSLVFLVMGDASGLEELNHRHLV